MYTTLFTISEFCAQRKVLGEMPQNFSYFMLTKTQRCFLDFSSYAVLYFPPNDCPGLLRYVDIFLNRSQKAKKAC